VDSLTTPAAWILAIHAAVGYPLVFVVAPLALASFAGRPPHRRVGVSFTFGMLFLYLTGSTRTFTLYPWTSWEFGRNVVFNLMGIVFLLHAVRAIRLWREEDAPRPTRADHALHALLTLNVVLMTLLALVQNTALRAFALLSIVLLVLDRADWRAGFSRIVLYRRHARYVLASYFYILTVVSVAHLRDELTPNARWLWPAALAILVVWIAHGAATPGALWRARAQKWAMLGTLAVSLAFGSYVGYEVWRDGLPTAPTHPPGAARSRG
jgi:hypothetical protein